MLRYGLVLVIGWIGLMKFTEYEAKGIQPLVANSPWMSRMSGFLTVQQFSVALGIVEVSIAILIGLRHWSARASVEGILQLHCQAIVVGCIRATRIQADGQPLLYWQGAYRQIALSEIRNLE